MQDIHDKLDSIAKDITDIKVCNAVQTEQLKEHMKRSDLLEKRVEQVDAELKPIKDHVLGIKFLFKILASASVVVGFVEALRRILG